MDKVPISLRNPRLLGVTLADYANVQAGIAEGLDLSALLQNEGVDVRAWDAASALWADRIAEDDEGSLEYAYDAFFEAALDRLWRAIPPLDIDLRAWLDFVRLWSAREDPLGCLAGLGMRPADIIRLNKHWARRLRADLALAREAEAILLREPGPMPSISPSPTLLRPLAPAERPPVDEDLPLPVAEDDEDEDDAQTSTRRPRLFVDPPGWERPEREPEREPEQMDAALSLDQYASLCAELAVFPASHEAIFQRHGLDPGVNRDAIGAAWSERLQRDRAQYERWQELYRTYHDYWTKRGAPAQ
ncbi:hypothetical protein [Chondromyces apiculatus]|uniref:Uncharacterized protein n=1 Tax=Chondromyces apiculatus DSM 436 TaxID=1192034 RepID=A0A017TGV6_9BACT|nr:hypothetical protein [Chondromyces apiculatus]EYF08508.1 Hypothetical protein CAP_4037 [Chondromyces apiculatus DSM 436]